ncbi:MAG TPA: response regulator transcription factor [Burkholderiales bacterium]|nr:response regulator transcription factor [Burkholderiales bacterium]
MRCRVLLADDHQLFRQGLRVLLEDAGHEIVGEAADGREALKLSETLQPEIAVLDLSMPVLSGLAVTQELCRVAHETKSILLTMYSDRGYVLQALKAGARGYVLKSQTIDDLNRAIREVRNGEVYLSPAISASVVDAYLHRIDENDDPLTPRERQILQLVAEGNTTKEVAKLLNVSFKTAESHRNRAMKKLDIHDVASLVRYAISRGLIHT